MTPAQIELQAASADLLRFRSRLGVNTPNAAELVKDRDWIDDGDRTWKRFERAVAASRAESEAVTTLRALIAWRDRMSEDEDAYPRPDPGCIQCTHGVTPDRYNTGLCAWHRAEMLLAKIDQSTAQPHGQGGQS